MSSSEFELRVKDIFDKLLIARNRMDSNDPTFNWDEIILVNSEFGLEQIKNRLNNELHLSDHDILRILVVITEEMKKLVEAEL